MLLQIHTDGTGDHATLSSEAEVAVRSALGRFGERITRIEVHLSDENAHKSGATDKRCLIEARVSGRPPIAASHSAADFGPAIHGAVEKLQRALDRTVGRGGKS